MSDQHDPPAHHFDLVGRRRSRLALFARLGLLSFRRAGPRSCHFDCAVSTAHYLGELVRDKLHHCGSEMNLVAVFQQSATLTTMYRLAQTVAHDPDATVFLAFVRTVIENPVFSGLRGSNDVGVLARDGAVDLVIFTKGQIVLS